MRRPATCLLLLLPLLAACHSKSDDRLKAIEDRIGKLEQAAAAHKAVTLKPRDTGYGLLDTDFGRVAVAIADVQPYAGGSRLILDFGNTSAARLNGMKAKIEWGSSDRAGLPDPAGAVRSLSFAAPEPLPAGSWRQYPVNLEGIPPARLGWVRVSAFDSGTVDLLSQ